MITQLNENQDRKLRILRHILTGVLLLMGGLVVVLTAIMLLGPDLLMQEFGATHPIAYWQTSLSLVVLLVGAALWIYAVQNTRNILNYMRQMNLDHAAQSAKLLARTFWIIAVFSLLADPIADSILNIGAPEGADPVSFEMGGDEIASVVAAVLAATLAQAFAIAAELWRDNKEVI